MTLQIAGMPDAKSSPLPLIFSIRSCHISPITQSLMLVPRQGAGPGDEHRWRFGGVTSLTWPDWSREHPALGGAGMGRWLCGDNWDWSHPSHPGKLLLSLHPHLPWAWGSSVPPS